MAILIADDHSLIRDGLRGLLLQITGGKVIILEAGTPVAAIDIVMKRGDIDLALIDYSLPADADGLNLMHLIHRHSPETSVAIISGNEGADIIGKCLAEGAIGFIPKSHSGSQMSAALRRLIAGEIYAPTRQGSPEGNRGTPPANPFNLTPRQAEVALMVARGLSNKDIGSRLEMTESTVKSHVSVILRQMGVSSRAEAIVMTLKLRVG